MVIFELGYYASRVVVFKLKYKKVGVLPIRIVWSNVSSIGPSSEMKTSIHRVMAYVDLFMFLPSF